jgi:hypothetical protein
MTGSRSERGAGSGERFTAEGAEGAEREKEEREKRGERFAGGRE